MQQSKPIFEKCYIENCNKVVKIGFQGYKFCGLRCLYLWVRGQLWKI